MRRNELISFSPINCNLKYPSITIFFGIFMRLRHEENRKADSKKEGVSFVRKLWNSATVRFLSAAAASAVAITPIAEGIAHAQDASPSAQDAGVGAQDGGTTASQPALQAYSGSVTQGSSVLSLGYSERVLDSQVFPSTVAEVRVNAVDESGVEFMLSIQGAATRPDQNAIFRVNYDGTRSGDVSVLQPLGIEEINVERGEGGSARVNIAYSSAPATSRPDTQVGASDANGGEVGTIRIIRPDRVDYRDRSLSYFRDEVDLAGNERTFTLNNRWDIGGNFYSNEGGQAVWASIRYAHRTPDSRPFNVRIDAGNIWFGRQEAPYLRLFLRPELNVWRLKGVYYGSVATMAEMPSYLYTSHALGVGYSQPIGENFRLRMGFIAGGALSYPAFDDIYFQMTGGISAEFHNFLVYGLVNSYFAASNPMETAFVGYYRPRFQNTEFGIQYRFMDNQYTARLFGDYGLLNQKVGARVTRSMTISDSVAADFWLAGGATHWAPEVGERWDPMVMAGMRIVFGGRHINSTNTAELDHQGRGGTEQVAADRPDRANPGPYGFGRSGNAIVDDQVNRAKDNMLSSGSFQEFSARYGSASTNETIMAARFMGAFLQQVAYANGAANALYSTDFFNSEVRRISGSSTDTMFGYMQRYVQFYNTHAPGDVLPDDLQNGIAICAGIHHLMAEFLRSNGIPTIVASVNTPGGPHVIAVATPPGSTVLLDYGNAYGAPANSFDEVIRSYGQYRQAPTFQSQLFNQDGYFTTYITAEGRLMRATTGIDLVRALSTDFLGVR